MAWGVSNLSVRFGATAALCDVTVSVEPGSVTTVVGGDGAGKSTLARTLVGLVRSAAGTVRRPDRVGYQSETSGVWGDLTVMENLGFVADAYRLAADERRRRIQRLLEITNLSDATNRVADHLSGGMRQKLGVAMALLPEPELLVLDEPTTGLDPVSRAEVWRVVEQYVAEGVGVLATTAYVAEAERGNRIVALDTGAVLAAGSADDVRASMQGVVATVPPDADVVFKWRRGRQWRAWFPDGRLPDWAEPAEPDLADVITVAALRRAA